MVKYVDVEHVHAAGILVCAHWNGQGNMAKKNFSGRSVMMEEKNGVVRLMYRNVYPR